MGLQPDRDKLIKVNGEIIFVIKKYETDINVSLKPIPSPLETQRFSQNKEMSERGALK